MKTGLKQLFLANAILFFLLVIVFGAKLIFLHLLEGDREKICQYNAEKLFNL